MSSQIPLQSDSRGSSRLTVILLVIVLALLGGLVASFYPSRSRFKPAPLVAHPPGCLKSARAFVPTNVTELPDPSVNALSAQTKSRVLFRANMEPCTCGCSLSVVACRITNPACETSRELLQKRILDEAGETAGASGSR